MFGRKRSRHEYALEPLKRRKSAYSIALTASLLLLGSCYVFTLFETPLDLGTFSSLNAFFASESSTDTNEEEENLHGLEPGKYHGPYPHSLLTLFYPYTILRDVVLDQPVSDTDVPFFWHLHNTDEKAYKQILTKCYGLELIELNDQQSIDEAKELDIVKSLDRYKHVITSPLIREALELFSTDNYARMICMTRHPLDYDLHPNLPTFERKDNWLTRYLSDWHTEDLTFKQLGIAKHVMREGCLMANQDRVQPSVIRIAEHMNWQFANDMTDEQGLQCIDEALVDFPRQRWMNHQEAAWMKFYKDNLYDCQLYEITRSVWRAQIQTIVPWAIQLSRHEDDEDDDEE